MAETDEEEESDSLLDSSEEDDEDSELDGFETIKPEEDERRKSIRQIRAFEESMQKKEQCNLPLPEVNPASTAPSPRTRRRDFQKRMQSQSNASIALSVTSARSPGDRMCETGCCATAQSILMNTTSQGTSMSNLSVPRHSGEMKPIRLPPWFRADNGFDKDRQDDILSYMRDVSGPEALLDGLTTKFKLTADQAKALLNIQAHVSNSTIMTSSSSLPPGPIVEPDMNSQPTWNPLTRSAERAEAKMCSVQPPFQKAQSVAFLPREDSCLVQRPVWGEFASQPVHRDRAAMSHPEPYRGLSHKTDAGITSLPPALSPGLQQSCSTSYLPEKSPYSSMSSLPHVEAGITLRHQPSLPKRPPVQITKTSSKRKTIGPRNVNNLYINQYLVKEKIGAGSYASVRRCTDITTGVEYAMKIVNKPRLGKQLNFLSMNPDEDEDDPLAKIWGEIAIMKKLNHTNIVNLVEVIDSKVTLYMILEYMKDGSVAKGSKNIESVIRDGHEKEDMETLRFWIRDITAGLAYLHANKMIHSDIKPENILIGPTGELKLADFGTSLMFTGKSSRILEITGTHAFMAPETIQEVSDEKFHAYPVDIWALGVTLYQLRYGALPFDGNDVVELYDAIENDPLIIPKDEETTLADLLKSLLDKDPKTRISMKDLCKHPWLTNDGELACLLHHYEGVVTTEYERDHAINKHRKLGVQDTLSSNQSLMGTSMSSLGDDFWGGDSDKDQFHDLYPSGGRPRSGTDTDERILPGASKSCPSKTPPTHRKHHSGDLMLVHHTSSLDMGLGRPGVSDDLKEADRRKELPRSSTDIEDRKHFKRNFQNRLRIHGLVGDDLPEEKLQLDHRDTGPILQPDLDPPANSNNSRQSVRVPLGGESNLLLPSGSGLERVSRADPKRLNLPSSGLTLDDDESVTMPSPHGELKPKPRAGGGTRHRGSVRFARVSELGSKDESRKFFSPTGSRSPGVPISGKGILKKNKRGHQFGGLSPDSGLSPASESDREIGFMGDESFSDTERTLGLSRPTERSPRVLASRESTNDSAPSADANLEPSGHRETVTMDENSSVVISTRGSEFSDLAVGETPPKGELVISETLLASGSDPANRRGSLLGRMIGRLRRKSRPKPPKN